MQTALSIQQILAQPKNTRLLAQLFASDAVVTRSDLARELCRRLDLRDPKGDWRLATTLKALRETDTSVHAVVGTQARLAALLLRPERFQARNRVPAGLKLARSLSRLRQRR